MVIKQAMMLLNVIDAIIKGEYRAPDMTRVREENLDSQGNIFVMENLIEAKPGIPYLLYRFDTNPDILFPYFNSGHNLRKMCDYVLFAEWRGRQWCLLIELKRGRENARPQLSAGEAFIRFIIAAAERVGKPIASNDIEFRQIRVAENTKVKGRLRADTPEYEDRYVNLFTDNIQLRYLLR